MPPVTCPDKLTYYGFSRVFEQQRGIGPVDPAPFIEKAHSIEALRRTLPKRDADEDELQAIYERQQELTEELEAEMKESALCTGSIVISFQGSDFFGNLRPYNSETISEPFFSGITLYNEAGTGDIFCAVFQGEKALRQKQAFQVMAQHPFFEGEAEKFRDIEKLFEALRMNGRPEDWTVIGILRSYNLFSGS
jgi:hypothetical protein